MMEVPQSANSNVPQRSLPQVGDEFFMMAAAGMMQAYDARATFSDKEISPHLEDMRGQPDVMKTVAMLDSMIPDREDRGKTPDEGSTTTRTDRQSGGTTPR